MCMPKKQQNISSKRQVSISRIVLFILCIHVLYIFLESISGKESWGRLTIMESMLNNIREFRLLYTRKAVFTLNSRRCDNFTCLWKTLSV